MARITHDKTINGKPVTHTEFLKEVITTIDELGPENAKVANIASKFGEEWCTPAGKKLLSQTLANMLGRGHVALVDGKPGLYRTTANVKRNGVNRFDADEEAILTVIRDHGGFCRFRDIMEAFGMRAVGEDAKDITFQPLYVRLIEVLRESKRIRQDFIQRGIYNVPWAEMQGLPVRGLWASMMIKVTWSELRQTWDMPATDDEGRPGWYKLREEFFTNVHLAFERLRTTAQMTVDELLDERVMRLAIADFERAAPTVLSVIYDEWRAYTDEEIERRDAAYALAVAQMEAGGGSAHDLSRLQVEHQADIDIYRDARQQELDLKRPIWLYKKFEKGDVTAHCRAPLSLYTAMAEVFGLCPASLSRGMIALLPYEQKVVPRKTRRPQREIEDAQIEVDLAIERTQAWLEEEALDPFDVAETEYDDGRPLPVRPTH